MSRHLTTAAYLAAWIAPPVALGACAVLAPWWVTAVVVVIACAAALWWVMRIPLGAP